MRKMGEEQEGRITAGLDQRNRDDYRGGQELESGDQMRYLL
jgi:hypothetical protein